MQLAGRWTVVHGSRSDVFRIWPLGDMHVPSVAFDEETFLRDREQIKEDPFALVVGIGDYGDFISPKDEKRWDARILDRAVCVQDLAHYGTYIMDRIAEYWEPIRSKTLGVAEGNHEYEYAKRHDLDPTRYLADKLKVPYLGYWSLFEILFVRKKGIKRPRLLRGRTVEQGAKVRCVVCVHHGTGAARTDGARLNRTVAASHEWLANLFIMGHLHDAIAKPKPIAMLGIGGETWRPFPRLCVAGGSYAKGYIEGVTSYAERYEMPLNTLGNTPIEIRPQANGPHSDGKHRTTELRITAPASLLLEQT